MTTRKSVTRAAISADSKLTANAGARVAEMGGNAVDIAVACALAATVAEVAMCSLGGSAFFMVHLPGQDAELIEGADAFPRIEQPPEIGGDAWYEAHLPYGDGVSVMIGHASIAVPGMLAAAEKTWQRHGSLPWKEVVAPALDLASRKIPASTTLSHWLTLSGQPIFWRHPASRQSFFVGDRTLEEGEPFQIQNLATTFEAISRAGADALYRGDLTASFVREMKEHGGLIGRQDLADYEAVVRRPLATQSGGFNLVLNPPPAVGGTAVGYLIRAVESGWGKDLTAADKVALHAQAQLELLGLRQHRLSNIDFDETMSAAILENAGKPGRGPLQSPNTTHFSVATADGGLVAVTMSMGYGSGVVIPELGIACNNGLGEPELNPSGYHRGRPGQRIPSNMAPTLAWNESDGRCLAIGSPGASRITTSIAQTWLHVVLDGMSYEQAVAAPRLHIEAHSNEIRAQFEPGIDATQLDPDLVRRPFEKTNLYFGGVKLAGIDVAGNLKAVADARREGAVEIVG